MNNKLKRLLSLAGVGALIGAGLVAGIVTPASAHTPEVTPSCNSITVSLTQYEYIPGTPAKLGTRVVSPAVAFQAAVYSDPVAEVSHTEWEYAPIFGSMNHWSAKDAGVWLTYDWTLYKATGNTRSVVDVPFQASELISVEIPAVAEVTEPYEVDVAKPAQDNSVEIFVDGISVLSERFGTYFSGSVDIDGTKNHSYKVVIDAIGTKYDKTITGKTTACPKVVLDPVVVVPTLPTCLVDGGYGFDISSPTGVDNGYNQFALGQRIFVDRPLAGPGNYKLTIKGVGAGAVGYENTFPYGTKVVQTEQNITVLPATGFHNSASGSEACFIAPQEPRVTNTEWVDGKYSCGDTKVAQTREVTTTTSVFDTKTGTFSDGVPVTVTESQDRSLTSDELKANECPILTPPTEEPKETVTTPVVTKTVTVDESLAQTGGQTNSLGLAIAGFMALLAGAGIFTYRKLGSN